MYLRSAVSALFVIVVVRQERQLLSAGEQARQQLQALNFLLELGHVLEASIDRSESHIGDLVEAAQFFHDEIADVPAVDLALAHGLEAVGDSLDRLFDLIARHGTLRERAHDAVTELLVIERLTPGGALDHRRHHELGRLEGREAFLARETLAPATHEAPFAREPRIDDFRVGVIAERTIHRSDYPVGASFARDSSIYTRNRAHRP